MRFVIGLGNPGSRYLATRHNVGFEVAHELVRRWGGRFGADRFGNLSTDLLVANEKIRVALPQKYMNRSGGPVRGLLDYYDGEPSEVIVIHDDLDLSFGTVKVKSGGGHGGHNGLRDLHRHLGGGGYDRVRVGVGRPPPGWEVSDYVLGRWDGDEKEELESIISIAADAIEKILRSGVGEAMNLFNQRPKSQSSAATL